MLVLRLGWRNLWRNPGRSALAVGAVAVAFAALMTLDGLSEGMARQMLADGTRLLLGQVQVHDAGYLPDRNFYDTVGGAAGADVPALLGALEARPGVRVAAPRAWAFGLLSTGPRSAGAELLGVEPAREARVTSLLDTVVEGHGLAGAPPRTVLLGRTLAEVLGARVGDEVAVVTQAADGSIGNELWRVRGIFRTGLVALDRSLAVVSLGDLQALLALGPGRVHEVALGIDDPLGAERVAADLAAAGVLPPRGKAESWERLAPALADYLRLLRGWNWIVVVIVGVFAGFGVLNSMLMAVFERTHELGVLASLGFRPSQTLAMVAAESVCLAAVGLAVGLGLGTGATAYLVWHGWDLTRWAQGLTIAGVLVNPVLHATFTWQSIPSLALSLGAITVLAALIPAVRAARLRPVQALAAPVE